jgi:transposase
MIYYQVTKKMSNAFDLRLRMVRMADSEGISATARYYRTTRRTVQKWVRRYREGGLGALQNRSRAPKRIPHKMSRELEKKILELRKKYPGWGPRRLKTYFDLPCSQGAVYRVLRQNRFIAKRKKKWKKRRDLRKIKATLKPFEKLILDGKDLTDIEHYWPQMRFKRLPEYQYTARDVRTGATYFAYSDTNDSTSATMFVRYVLEHLAACGVDLGTVTVQTDNGSDLIGSANKKPSTTSAFEAMLDFLGVNHVRIPPASPTWNSDVETFHRLCEDEFYDIETFLDHQAFFDKAATYQLFFNTERKNSWKQDKTPLDLVRQLAPEIDPNRAVSLRPIALGSLIQSAYHVPALPKMAKRSACNILSSVVKCAPSRGRRTARYERNLPGRKPAGRGYLR